MPTDTSVPFRQPEYTGENRCWPCTIANVAIAAVGSAALAYLLAPVVGAAAFALSLSAIWLRGYLVPYTPTLTKRYFPDRVLAWFDKHPASAGEKVSDVEVEEELVSAGIVEPCEHEDDLCLAPAFETAWRTRIETVRQSEVEPELLRDLFPVDVSEIEFERREDAIVARMDRQRIAQWESEAALLADVAAGDVLQDRFEGWNTYTFDAKIELIGGLRLFLETCPDCDGPLSFDEEVVESCCRSIDVVALTCESCDSRLFEAELQQEMRETESGQGQPQEV